MLFLSSLRTLTPSPLTLCTVRFTANHGRLPANCCRVSANHYLLSANLRRFTANSQHWQPV